MSFNKILPVKPAAKKTRPVEPADAVAPAKPAPRRRKPASRRPIGG
jgi:hypothetical protein